MSRDRFVNPVSGEVYSWHINHSDEEEVSKERSITRTSNTGNVGVVRQQGDDGPLLLRFTGSILHRAQLVAMWRFYAMCHSQTIHFYDFDDQAYEVQIIAFSPVRKRTLRNPRDSSAPMHYWTYSITMEVYAYINGDMRDAGVPL
jgi:hypothetical protein